MFVGLTTLVIYRIGKVQNFPFLRNEVKDLTCSNLTLCPNKSCSNIICHYWVSQKVGLMTLTLQTNVRQSAHFPEYRKIGIHMSTEENVNLPKLFSILYEATQYTV